MYKRMTVATAEITIEPIQPMRLEKKKNIAATPARAPTENRTQS
jgi:hypothetical protein